MWAISIIGCIHTWAGSIIGSVHEEKSIEA
jgi:hypothetical protein